MATFSQLPTELVEYVVQYLAQPDLYAFCQANRSLHALTLPVLYRRVDLFIPPGDKLPRIDRFCLSIINEPRLAGCVETLRLGLSPHEGVKEGQHWLPTDKHFDDGLMFDKAMDAFNSEALVAAGDYLRDAIGMREYSAYAALILVILPNLQQLEIADFKCASLDHVYTTLRNLDNLDAGPRWNSRRTSVTLPNRLLPITHISLNFDRLSELVYPRNIGHSTLDHILNFSGITKLEISVQDGQEAGTSTPHPGLLRRMLVSTFRPTNISVLVIRHSGPLLHILSAFLECTPRLQPFTYAMFYDVTVRTAMTAVNGDHEDRPGSSSP